jgi:hypothetical protein
MKRLRSEKPVACACNGFFVLGEISSRAHDLIQSILLASKLRRVPWPVKGNAFGLLKHFYMGVYCFIYPVAIPEPMSRGFTIGSAGATGALFTAPPPPIVALSWFLSSLVNLLRSTLPAFFSFFIVLFFCDFYFKESFPFKKLLCALLTPLNYVKILLCLTPMSGLQVWLSGLRF